MDPTPGSYLLCQQHIFSSEVLFIEALSPQPVALQCVINIELSSSALLRLLDLEENLALLFF